MTEKQDGKRMVIPEGAKWHTSKILESWLSLVVDGVEVARVDSRHNTWTVEEDGWNYASSTEAAQHAAEKALADAGLYGFEWEEVEPEYVRYQVATISKVGASGGISWTRPDFKDHAVGYYDGCRLDGDMALVVLSAQDEQLVWHELDRYEASGE